MKEEVQKRLLKKILKFNIGLDADKLVGLLYNREKVNEADIAKKMGLTINQIRNILYKLADQGFISFVRKKDKKKAGWYTYFWTLDAKRVLSKFKEKSLFERDKLEREKANRETERFYFCKNCEIEYNEESALGNDYTCPECGQVLDIREVNKLVEHLNNEINKIKEAEREIDEELIKIEEADVKSKNARIKREERQKKLKRKKKAEERKRLVEKEKKKSGKIKISKIKTKVIKKNTPKKKSSRKR